MPRRQQTTPGRVRDLWYTTDPDTGRQVKTARHGVGNRWQSVHRHPTTHKEVTKSFPTRAAANRHLIDAISKIETGEYLARERGRTPLATYLDRWLASLTCTKNTRQWYRGSDGKGGIQRRIREEFGDTPIADITAAQIAEWLAGLVAGGMSPSRANGHRTCLGSVMDHALKDRANGEKSPISFNPVREVRRMREPKKTPKVISMDVLAQVIVELGRQGNNRDLMGLLFAFCGPRFGELVALRVGDVEGKTIAVDKAIATVCGRAELGDTKSHRQRRIPVPASIHSRIMQIRYGEDGKLRPASEPLFKAPRGGTWAYTSWYRAWKRAVANVVLADEIQALIDGGMSRGRAVMKADADARASGRELPTTHWTRHTAASVMIESGADVKAVQKVLGHASAAMTLDVYAEMFDGRLEEIAEVVDLAAKKVASDRQAQVPGRHLRAV